MASQQIRGLDASLKTLGKMAPVLRAEAIKSLKNDVKPIVAEIKAGIPNAPLSNWVAPKQSSARRGTVSAGRSGAEGMPYWEKGKAKRGVHASVAKMKALGKNTKGKVILISVRQTNGAGEVFDMAGKKSTNAFTQNLGARWGDPSRLMWPTVERHRPQVLASIERSVTSMTEMINEALRDQGRSTRTGGPVGSSHFR